MCASASKWKDQRQQCERVNHWRQWQKWAEVTNRRGNPFLASFVHLYCMPSRTSVSDASIHRARERICGSKLGTGDYIKPDYGQMWTKRISRVIRFNEWLMNYFGWISAHCYLFKWFVAFPTKRNKTFLSKQFWWFEKVSHTIGSEKQIRYYCCYHQSWVLCE